MSTKITEEILKNTLVCFVSEYKRFPTRKECEDTDWLYGWSTYIRTLGSFANLDIVDYIQAGCTLHPNTHKGQEAHKGVCLNCAKQLTQRHSVKYCSNTCQQQYEMKIRISSWYACDENVLPKLTNSTIRNMLAAVHGYKCSCCGLSEWNGKPITLEVEHISGDSTDNSPQNVCLICPNCHSQTHTYKGKNKGKGRFKRSQRYRDGKSY